MKETLCLDCMGCFLPWKATWQSLSPHLNILEWINGEERERADGKTAQQMLESTLTVASWRIHILLLQNNKSDKLKNPNPKYPLFLSKRSNWLSLKQPVVSLIKLFNQTWNQTHVLRSSSPHPACRHHRGDNDWALGRSGKATTLLGQLGTFTQNHESVTLLLNHNSPLPKEKIMTGSANSFASCTWN